MRQSTDTMTRSMMVDEIKSLRKQNSDLKASVKAYQRSYKAHAEHREKSNLMMFEFEQLIEKYTKHESCCRCR